MPALLASLHAPGGRLPAFARPYFRAFLCSALVNLPDSHVFLFVSPPDFADLLAASLNHSRLHILATARGENGTTLQSERYESYRALVLGSSHAVSSHTMSKVVIADALDVVIQDDV